MKSEISIKAAIYLRAAELVEIGHCKGAFGQDAYGQRVASDEIHKATRFCYYGAIFRASGQFGESKDLCGALSEENFDLITNWNDHTNTTPAMVAAKLREEAFK